MAELNDGEDADARHTIDYSIDDRGMAIVRLSGDIDITNVDALRRELEGVVAQRPPRLVFDLTALDFMDSSGIALMLFAAEHIESVELRNPSPIVRRIVEATGVAEILRITS